MVSMTRHYGTTPLFKRPDARAALFGFVISAALLGGAWFFQYVLGYAPCIMCYWQRHAHKVVLAVAAATIAAHAFGGLPRWLGPMLLVSAFVGSFVLGAFHVGVEFGLWDGPAACAASVGDLPSIDPNDPLAILDGEFAGPSCSDVAWRFLGISMAGWNALISLFGALGTYRLATHGVKP